MSHYKTNLRDIEFNLFEVLGRDEVLGTGPFGEIDGETARSILAEVDRLSREELAASYVDSDRNPPVFDPATGEAPLPESFKTSYRAWMDAEYWRLSIVEELGGTYAPSSLNWAIGEMVLGANAPIWMYAAGPAFAGVVHRNGNERDKRIAQLIVEREWGTTMVLTEPDAGSDVGAGRAKATPNEDGSWNIEGVKRFITSGESDLQDNIIHLVLARPVGVEGVGGPGTKGLSLFIVPKFHFDHETGELTGERNGAYVTNVEHKMGIKVSNTCEVTFGDPGVGGGEPAQGWLLGEVHDGIAQMFQVIENARMMVGTKAIATLSTGYLNALDYAKSRIQGADLTQSGDKTAPRVTITHHPDVRRSLLVQKSFAEAMRALVLYTASWQDKVQIAEHEGTTDTRRDQARHGGQRPAAPDREGLRLGALVGAAGHRVAADLRRLRLPPGVPGRAVRPGRQDRHPLRGHDRDPGPGLLLPQDRQGPGPRARAPGEGDRVLHRQRGRQRPPQGRAGVARHRARGRQRDRRPHDQRPDVRGPVLGDRRDPQHLQGRAQHDPPADGCSATSSAAGCCSARRRSRWRSWAARPARSRPRTRRSTRARSRPRSSSRSTTCPGSAPSARSPRPPTCRSWTSTRPRSDRHSGYRPCMEIAQASSRCAC